MLLFTIAGMTFYLSLKKMESEFEDRTKLPDWLTNRKDVEDVKGKVIWKMRIKKK